MGHKGNRVNKDNKERLEALVLLVRWAPLDLQAGLAPLEALVPRATPDHLDPRDPRDASDQLVQESLAAEV